MVEAAPAANGANKSSWTSTITPVPIAQLRPELTTPALIKAVVTLIWPYSSTTGHAALLLAEPDFRLRRERGQVRVRLTGSSGRAVADSGIGSGDMVTLSLEGVEWVQEESRTRLPGRGIEWELAYTDRLLLEIRHDESQNVSVIDVDHPTAATELSLPKGITPEEFGGPPTPLPSSRKFTELETENPEEWDSPAFIKRARTSYGSLFGPSDIFAEEEDGPRKGKRRRRSSKMVWRYTSRSPSPTPSEASDRDKGRVSGDALHQTPAMTDEGLQANGAGNASIDATQSEFRPLASLSTFQDTPGWTTANTQPLGQQESGNQQLTNGNLFVSAPSASRADYDTGEGFDDPNSKRNQNVHDGLQSSSMADLQYSDQYEKWQRTIATNNKDLSHLSPQYPYLAENGLPGQDSYQQSGAHHQGDDEPGLQVKATDAEDTMLLVVQDGDQNMSRRPSNSGNRSHHSSASHTPASQLPRAPLSHSRSAQQVVTGGSDNEMAGDADDKSEPEQDPRVDERFDNDGGDESDGDEAQEEEEEDGGFDEQSSPTPWKRDSHSNLSEWQVYDEDEDEDKENEYDGDLQPQDYAPEDEHAEYGEEDEDDEDVQDQYDQYGDDQDAEPPAYNSPERPNPEITVISLLSDDEEEDAQPAPQSSAFDRKAAEESVSQSPKQDYRSDEDEMNVLGLDDDEYDVEDEEGDEAEDKEENKDEDEEEDEEENDSGAEVEESETKEFSEPAKTSPSRETCSQVGEDLDSSSRCDDKSPEQSLFVEGPRRRRLQSFDGVADDLDDKNIAESHKDKDVIDAPRQIRKVLRSFDGAVTYIYNENIAESHKENLDFSTEAKFPVQDDVAASQQAEEENKEPVESEKFSAEKVDVQTNANQENESDPSSPMRSLKAQILDILSDEEQAAEPPALKSGHSDSGNEAQIRQDNLAVEEVPVEEDAAEEDADEQVTVEDVTAEKMEKTVVPEATLMDELALYRELQAAADDTELTDTPLYPTLPLNEADEEDDPKGASLLRAGAPKNGQLPTPANTQMTDAAYNASPSEGTQTTVSVSRTQMTETTSSTSLRGEIMGGTIISTTTSAIEITDVTKTVLLKETNQLEEPVEANAETILNNGDGKDEPPITRSRKRLAKAKKADMVIETHLIPDEPQSLPATPRRSRRQASKVLNSPKPIIASQKASPVLGVMDEALTPDGYDASAELALASYHSPSKQNVADSQSTTVSPTPLKRSLRTDRGEYTILRDLRIKQGRRPDILAIATTASSKPQQAKKPPKDWLIDFNITDASVNPSVVTRVAIFRAKKTALPLVSPGDGILLRNFKVQTEKDRRFSLRSESDSSWAVIKADCSVAKSGPPIEAGDEEFNHLASMKQWFASMPAAQREVLQKAHMKADKGKGVAGSK